MNSFERDWHSFFVARGYNVEEILLAKAHEYLSYIYGKLFKRDLPQQIRNNLINLRHQFAEGGYVKAYFLENNQHQGVVLVKKDSEIESYMVSQWVNE